MSDAATSIPQGKAIQLGQYRYWLRDSGDFTLPVLVCLHGFPSSSWDFARIWPLLAPHFRLIALDWLGLGRSDKPHPHVYRIAEQADLIELLLSQFKIERVALLAHDYGDTVAQELLARQMDGRSSCQFSAVVLLNGGLFPEAHRARWVQRLLARPWLGPLLAQLLSRRRFERSMRAIFGPNSPPDAEFLESTWADLAPLAARRVLPALLSYLQERRSHRTRWVRALTEATVPVRFVVGTADPISGAHMATRYRELLSNADICELEQIGHYPQWEAPEAVAAAALPVLLAPKVGQH